VGIRLPALREAHGRRSLAHQAPAGVSLRRTGARAVASLTTSRCGEQGHRELWLLSTGAGRPRLLTTCGEKDGQPMWRQWAAESAFVPSANGGQEGRGAQIYLIDADGGEARRLSSLPRRLGDQWFPDGSA